VFVEGPAGPSPLFLILSFFHIAISLGVFPLTSIGQDPADVDGDTEEGELGVVVGCGWEEDFVFFFTFLYRRVGLV